MRQPPKVCDNCENPKIVLSSNEILYGEVKGDWPYIYFCGQCKASVRCHSNTYNPVGLMASSSTKRRRTILHDLFDPIWQLKYISRDEAYQWLAKELNLFSLNCHISELTDDQLKRAILIMRAHKSTEYTYFQKRKRKDDIRRNRQASRQHTKINIRRYGKS